VYLDAETVSLAKWATLALSLQSSSPFFVSSRLVSSLLFFGSRTATVRIFSSCVAAFSSLVLARRSFAFSKANWGTSRGRAKQRLRRVIDNIRPLWTRM
jgi:hypothetical protein